jgi:hypothetical protein
MEMDTEDYTMEEQAQSRPDQGDRSLQCDGYFCRTAITEHQLNCDDELQCRIDDWVHRER